MDFFFGGRRYKTRKRRRLGSESSSRCPNRHHPLLKRKKSSGKEAGVIRRLVWLLCSITKACHMNERLRRIRTKVALLARTFREKAVRASQKKAGAVPVTGALIIFLSWFVGNTFKESASATATRIADARKYASLRSDMERSHSELLSIKSQTTMATRFQAARWMAPFGFHQRDGSRIFSLMVATNQFVISDCTASYSVAESDRRIQASVSSARQSALLAHHQFSQNCRDLKSIGRRSLSC